MKKRILSIAIFSFSMTVFSQYEPFPNGGFEQWETVGGYEQPVHFHTNKDGSSTARLGPITASKVTSGQYSGSACVVIESKGYLGNTIIVNGNLTTGFINAPSTQKVEGYIGTQNYDDPTESRKFPFTSRPDSLIGYFKYKPANDAEEKGKINVVLHKGEFNDPETPVNGNHDDLSANFIGNALFITEHQNYDTWTRFSVPFEYATTETPENVLVNITSSNNQLTTKAGSKFWLDSLAFVYIETIGINEAAKVTIPVYKVDNTIMVNLSDVTIQNPQLVMIDLSGKEILTTELEINKNNEIVIPAIQPGMYVYRIVGDNFVNNGKIQL